MSEGDELELLEAALAAQEQLRGSLPDTVVDATVAALRQQIDAARRRHEPKRRRLATVLFADISGSTELGETIDAEELSDRFDALWSTIDRIIESHGGTIDKHIGDAVMALWGVGDSGENDPERAIRAGLEMLAALDGLRERDVLPGTAMRIGINTGPVVFGAIAGTAEATAMGDTVNVAARLESAAPLGSVLIGQDTYQHVRGIFSVGLREPLTVKGKRRPLQTYVVEGVRPRAFRLHARMIDGVETPMIARDAELGALQQALERAVDTGRPELALITGAAGMGKSRLLFEFEDWLRARDGEVRRFSGRGDPEQRGTAYSVLRDVVFDRFQIAEDERAPIARAKLEVGIRELAGDGLEHEIAVIGHLIGLGDGPSAVSADAADGAASLARVLAAVSERMPVVMLLEDLHWADRASARLFRLLVDDLRDGRILIVGVHRTIDGGAGPTANTTVTIELGPLSDDEIATLVFELLARADPIPAEVIDRVTAAAGGNPFYVEELVRMFLDEGVVVVDDQHWTFDLERLRQISVPTTLRGVLQARLDRLEASELDLLMCASVVGPRFWTSSLPTARRVDIRQAAPTTIEALIDKGLVQRVATSDFTGDDEFRFAHALLHEVVYESILLGERAGMHEQVATWMAARAESAAATIASHFRAAGRLADAARWSATEAKRARDRNAAEEGIAAAEAALADGQLDERAHADCLDDLIECLTIAARYDEAYARTDELQAAGEALGDPALRALAHSIRSHLMMRLGRSREALREVERAIDVVDELPFDDAAAIDALTELGWVMVRMGRGREAVRHADDALGRLGNSTNIVLRRRVFSLAGVASMTAGRFADADRHLEASLEVSRLQGDRRNEAGCLINLSEIARLRGDLARAAEQSEAALDLVRDVKDRDQEALVLSNLGGIRVEQGDAARALPLLMAAVEAFEQSGGSEHTSETHRFLAEAYLEAGDHGRARAEAGLAFDLAEHSENPDHLGHAWVVAGRICATTGAPWSRADGDVGVDAVGCLERAGAIFADAGLERERALTLVRLAEVGDDREALVGEAHRLLVELDLPLLAQRVTTGVG